MDESMARRHFLKTCAVTALGAGALALGQTLAAGAESPRRFYKGVKIGMLPAGLTDAEKFKLARRAGFDGIDATPLDSDDALRRQADLAREAGAPIHGLVFGWAAFGEADPAAREADVVRMQQALRQAKMIGVDTVLLVPARVTDTVGYGDAYKRSQEAVRRLIPAAEQTGVTIAIENVWSKFLLSPLEFARYLDELDSPFVRAYFDVGNVIIHGYAEDWIRTLGPRIVKLDIKDFKRDGYAWKNLGEGDVNWPAVRQALDAIEYRGWATCELEGGDEAYLTDLAGRVDRLLIQ